MWIRLTHSTIPPAGSLTPAELQVLSFLPTHLTIEGIAQRLGRGRSTIKTHVANIYKKLGAATRGDAVQRAWELGLLTESKTQPSDVALRPANRKRSRKDTSTPPASPADWGQPTGTSNETMQVATQEPER